jgi:hypothetical protein
MTRTAVIAADPDDIEAHVGAGWWERTLTLSERVRLRALAAQHRDATETAVIEDREAERTRGKP